MWSVNLSASNKEEKIGQLIVVPLAVDRGEDHIQQVAKLMKERYIRTIIAMPGTTISLDDAVQFIENELDSEITVFMDAEWGIGMRMRDIPPLPKAVTLGAIQDGELLREFAKAVGKECREIGVICPLAPMVDINVDPDNPITRYRSLGRDPKEVAKAALQIHRGMQEGGVWTCAKHFPGHGDTVVDSHCALPVIESMALEPFQELIDDGVDLVMVGHLLYPQLSGEPSSLSREIITDLLREKMGFSGVVITDALNMKALDFSNQPGIIAEKALRAGVDLLLFASNDEEELEQLIGEKIPAAIDHLIEVVEEDLLDEKIARIEALFNKKSSQSLLYHSQRGKETVADVLYR